MDLNTFLDVSCSFNLGGKQPQIKTVWIYHVGTLWPIQYL